jgi:hypothetical protein
MNSRLDRHVSDAELVQLTDGELAPDEQSRLSAHLEKCGQCSDALVQLRSDLDAAARALDTVQLPAGFRWPQLYGAEGLATTTPGTDERLHQSGRRAREIPAPERRFSALRAAAVVLIVAAAAIGVGPLYAWLAESAGFRRIEEHADDIHEDVAFPGATGRLLFPAAAAEFSIDFNSTQTAGSVTVSYWEGADASFEAFPSAGPARTVAEGSLHLDNEPATRDSYIVQLPTTVRRVRIVVQGSVRYTGPLSPSRLVVQLQD